MDSAARRPRLPPWAIAASNLLAAFTGGFLGLHLGEAFAFALARLVDRDIAELKDVLIWCTLLGALIGALAGIWLTLRLARARLFVERGALAALGLAALCSAGIVLAAYPWPKSSGAPVIDYELRLPDGLPPPTRSTLSLTIWAEKNGHGCSIRRIGIAGARPEIAGTMVLDATNWTPTVSLRLANAAEGTWQLPYRPDAKLEKSFGPWQRLQFIATPRGQAVPLPPGAYDIRYRVRRYL